VSFSLNINNGLPIRSWYSDKHDRELYKLIPILEELAVVDDVRDSIKKFVAHNEIDFIQAHEVLFKYKKQIGKTNENKNENLEKNNYDINKNNANTNTNILSIANNASKEKLNGVLNGNFMKFQGKLLTNL